MSQMDDRTLSSDEFDDFLDERLQGAEHDHDDEEFERLLNEAENIHVGNVDDISDEDDDGDDKIGEEKGRDQLTQETDRGQEKTEANDDDTDAVTDGDGEDDEIVVVDFHHGEEEIIALSTAVAAAADERMMRSPERGEGERHILVQEVVDARVSTFISSLLNRFGKIVSVPNQDELRKMVETADVYKEEQGEKKAISKGSAMLSFGDLTQSLQHKIVLVEHVVGSIASILERSALKQATFRRQRDELRRYCLSQQNEIKRMHEELQTQRKKCSRLQQARKRERQFLLQEIEKHRQTIAQVTQSDPPPAPDLSQLLSHDGDAGVELDEEFSLSSMLSKSVLGSVLSGWTQPQESTSTSTALSAQASSNQAADTVNSVLGSLSSWWSSGSSSGSSSTTTTAVNQASTPSPRRQNVQRSTGASSAAKPRLRLEQRQRSSSQQSSSSGVSSTRSTTPRTNTGQDSGDGKGKLPKPSRGSENVE